VHVAVCAGVSTVGAQTGVDTVPVPLNAVSDTPTAVRVTFPAFCTSNV